MAIDAAGRLYVTASAGVHVLSPRGRHLGLIPTKRRPMLARGYAGRPK